MRGILNRNKDSKIYADGKTYDNKLYTFKECDYKSIWYALDVMVKNLDEKTALKNLPSARENKKKNNRMIDKALEKKAFLFHQRLMYRIKKIKVKNKQKLMMMNLQAIATMQKMKALQILIMKGHRKVRYKFSLYNKVLEETIIV